MTDVTIVVIANSMRLDATVTLHHRAVRRDKGRGSHCIGHRELMWDE